MNILKKSDDYFEELAEGSKSIWKCAFCSFETGDKEIFEKHKSIYHKNRIPKKPYDSMTNEEFIEYEKKKEKKSKK